MLNAAIQSVLNPNDPTVLETSYSGGGGENSIDVNEQEQHLGDFYHVEEIAGLIVLGLFPWSPEVCKPCGRC